MAAPRHIKRMRIVMTLIVVALFGLLAATLWWAISLWNALDPEPMPGWMYGAMAGGIVFSLLIGCGLMALVFYSARHGYDDRASGDFDR
jgi:Zn-dependent protease with chaperone function